jgi:hypothetical protein
MKRRIGGMPQKSVTVSVVDDEESDGESVKDARRNA